MSRGLIVISLLLVSGAVACSSSRVTVGHDPGNPLEHAKLYDWLPAAHEKSRSPIDEKIKAAIDSELRQTGLRQSSQHPDIEVSYYAVSPRSEPYGMPPQPWHWQALDSIPSFDDGSLTLEFVDPKTGKSTWMGSVSPAFNGPSIQDIDIQQAAKRLVAEARATK